MKVPYRWLADWIDVPWAGRELGARLTMAGFELESIDSSVADDPLLEVAITPNRGDAMSIRGVAREVAALAGRPLRARAMEPVPPEAPDTFRVELAAPAACPKFVGRVIRDVNIGAQSPDWMRERLLRCGVRSINPVVDITNYVMLELGTPMHAYDLAKLQGAISVRFAEPGENLRLLDGQDVAFGARRVLTIADAAGPVGIAGIMGGERTAVSASTRDVFLEVAYFKPEVVSAGARSQGLITDAAQRFERGVDPRAQEESIERATRLLIEIAGGRAGPVVVTTVGQHLPTPPTVSLRRRQLARLIGMEVADNRVEQILASLGMQVKANAEGWDVVPPSHRFDITIEADLIEEVARIAGFAAVPEVPAKAAQVFDPLPEAQLTGLRALEILAARGYHEAITYSFVDPQLQAQLFPGVPQLPLRNPISADMASMRVSLWPGLLQAARANLSRQQSRVRLVEHGNKFVVENGSLREVNTLCGVVLGGVLPEQWDEKARPADFFDVKGDVEAVLAATGCADEFQFSAQACACLHPGRSARITRRGSAVGWLGELHPELAKALDFTYPPLLFELETALAFPGKRPVFEEISKYPSIRRDLAVVVDEAVTLAAIREHVSVAAGSLLRDLTVFDVYRGQGVDSGRKSVALGLILQETSRTLADRDADQLMGAVVERLRRELNASIRDQ